MEKMSVDVVVTKTFSDEAVIVSLEGSIDMAES